MFPGVHAATTPDKIAVVMAGSGRSLTYRELDDASAALAKAWHDLGLRPGDVVAMFSDNALECLTVYWAALRSGLYITAINRHLAPAESAYIVTDSGAKVLMASAGIAAQAEAIRALLPEVSHAFAFGGEIAGYGSMEELIAAAGSERLADQPRGADMLYSSGTTGRPKGIKPPLLGIQVDQPGDPITGLAGMAFKLGPEDVYLSPAPVYHAAPLKWCSAVHAYGGTVVMMEKFGAAELLSAVERFGVTVTQVVPTMFVRMLQLPEDQRRSYDVSSLRLAIHAAAPCPPEVKDAMIDWLGPILVEYYSSTEANGLTLITTPEWQAHRGSVGRSMLGPAHICDDDGNELEVGEVGTVYFEREVRPFEYHNDPEKTKEAEHPVHSSWTTVGDLGRLDEDGYLYLTDRKAFMIISGGVNIYPQEVEDVLIMHPAVHDVAVVGLPDPEMGEQVKAVVQVRPGVETSDALAAELIEYVRERVAHYKAPRTLDFVDDLPRTPTGKLLKRTIVDTYLSAAAR
ncbi:acyl-CoA synthetase [Nocardioides daeguensis]|uniref:Acyl-CoA synthetase n=1 Tax=Nocardioides daeguensis TaxID=908359 RepID=A0ABP6UVD3_9ACTN|nr:acyl-CoA synthetase [Nocardioides daeguensis]MBV6725571.1 acyl-CoA synthetase [Nocardioides daeguensis]MCR1771431.1 acyl-CoA synthetase [Nocardioides daeguensis]